MNPDTAANAREPQVGDRVRVRASKGEGQVYMVESVGNGYVTASNSDARLYYHASRFEVVPEWTAADQAAIDALKARNIAAAVADNERARARGAETTTANEMFGQRVWDAAWAQSVEARLAKHGQRLDALEKPSGDAERIKDVAEQPNG